MAEYDPHVYWIWLQHALGAGSTKPNRILAACPSLRGFYEAGRQSWLLEGYFSQKELRAMEAWSAEEACALLDYCTKLGQHVVTPDDAEYPELLRQIPNPPCALYVRGDLSCLDGRLAIAVVGTRRATATGRSAGPSSSAAGPSGSTRPPTRARCRPEAKRSACSAAASTRSTSWSTLRFGTPPPRTAR